MSYLDEVNEKRKNLSDRTQTAMMLKAVQSGQKPSIILTDSTDLGEHIAELGEKIIGVMNTVRADKSTKEQIDRLASDFKTLTQMAQQAAQEQTDRVCNAIEELRQVVTEQKPIVVPAPRVSLAEKDVDFSPLVQELKTILTPKAVKKQINLGDYRAIDLDNAPDGVQYVGFQNSTGGWYILQNDDRSNTIRYYFGKGSYEAAWDDKYSHDYKTLSEAVK